MKFTSYAEVLKTSIYLLCIHILTDLKIGKLSFNVCVSLGIDLIVSLQ